MTKLFRREVLEQKAYHLDHYPGVIKLDQNELAYDFSPAMKREWLRQLKEIPLQRYPLVRPKRLQSALARQLKVKEDQILLSPGSNVMISTLVAATAVGGTVMAVDPGFGLYPLAARALGNRYLPLSLKGPDFSLDLKEALKKIKRFSPQLIFIANPNAPTGNLFAAKDLLKITSAAPGLVVIDEAYRQFSGVSLLPRIKRHPNLVILQTFSKAWGLGGARVGYMVARAEVTAQVEKVLSPYCINPLSEGAALVALRHRAYYQKIIAEVIAERTRLFKEMGKLKSLKVYPSAANFLLFRVGDAKGCFRFLLGKKILIRDMSSHPRLKGCLRVSIGRPKENRAFLTALREYSTRS